MKNPQLSFTFYMHQSGYNKKKGADGSDNTKICDEKTREIVTIEKS